MIINLLVLILSLVFIVIHIIKLYRLYKGNNKEIEVIGFKQKFHKRYTYFIPVIKFDSIEKEWIDNPKLEQSLLNKKINVIFVNDRIFEKNDFIKSYIIITISLFFSLFAAYNIYILFK